jgi:glycosyltransferase involved in cell wall biosynthesis
MIWFYWITGLLLAAVWAIPVIRAAIYFRHVADLTLPEHEPPQEAKLPPLTIVVPARNEAETIEPAMRSLLRLNYPDYRIIAVNDRSTDATGEILEKLAASVESGGRLRVVHVQQLPAGWLGKTHAMWLGAEQALLLNGARPSSEEGGLGGDWILFTDADCIFHPGCLRRALFYAVRTGTKHLALMPTGIMHSLSERMMMSFPQVAANLAMRPWKVRDPQARDFVGVGAFNLISRPAYNAVGTYQKMSMAVVDDLKLGEAVKQAGLRQDIVYGKDLVRVRWLIGAWGIVRNLEKNLFALFRFRMSLAIAACLAVLLICVWPFAGIFLAPGLAKTGFAVAILMVLGMHLITARVSTISPLIFLTFPLAALVFVTAVLRSSYVALRDGGITWRGTKYSLEELRKKG